MFHTTLINKSLRLGRVGKLPHCPYSLNCLEEVFLASRLLRTCQYINCPKYYEVHRFAGNVPLPLYTEVPIRLILRNWAASVSAKSDTQERS